MKQRVLTLFIFSLYIFSSCTQNNNVTLPDCGIPIEHMNNEVILVPISAMNTGKQGDTLFSQILIKENMLFKAPVDLNIEIYQFYEDKWVKIENQGKYFGQDYVLDSNESKATFAFHPITIEGINRAKIFVCISGEIIDDEIQKAGASTFLVLSGEN